MNYVERHTPRSRGGSYMRGIREPRSMDKYMKCTGVCIKVILKVVPQNVENNSLDAGT